MKIFVFTDTHGSMQALKEVKKKIKASKPDLTICLGDFTIFGQDQKQILTKINKLGTRVLLFHGNHEFLSEVKEDIKDLKNIKLIHKKVFRESGILFLGYGGGGFSLTEPKFKEVVEIYKKFKEKGDKVVLLTHGPPFGTELDKLLDNQHCGCKTYTNFIKKYKPDYAFSGHIHECEGNKQVLGKTLLMNPGPLGKIINI